MNKKRKNRYLLSFRHHFLVASLYLVLALLMWWPLPLHLTTHVPGSNTWAFDEYTFVWNIWWFRHALLDLNVNPLHSDYIFHPLGMDLVLYTYNLFNAMFALPLLDWLGVVLTSNLVLIATTVLSGWGTWLLVRWLLARTQGALGTTSHVAAWGAGVLYALGAYRAVYAALGHYDLVSTGFFPLFTLFFLKVFWGKGTSTSLSDQAEAESSHLKYWTPALLTGIFMTGILLSEMSLGIFAAMLGLILMVVTWRQATSGWFMRMIVAVLTAAFLWSPVGVTIMRTLLSADFILSGWGDALKLSADLFSFTSPTALHPLWGPNWEQELRNVQVNVVSPGSSRFSDVNTVFVGISTLVLCAFAALRFRREVRVWVIGLFTFMIFALGPVLQVGGRYLWTFDNLLPDGQPTAIPLPFVLLHYIPIVQGNRASNRFSVVLMLCAAVLVGYAMFSIAQTMQQRTKNLYAGVFAVLLLSLVLLIEQLALPLPLTDARIPEGYQIVKEDPDDIAILTLPLGWRNSFGVVGAENTRNEWYMAGHEKRLLQGNTSRAPAQKFEYWKKVPVLHSLIEIQNDREVPEEQRLIDLEEGLNVMSLFGVRYVVVHPGIEGRPPYVDNRERALRYIQEVLPLELLYEKDDFLLYRIQTTLASSGEIDFGIQKGQMYRVSGWHDDEVEGNITYNWAMANAQFLLPIANADSPLNVTIKLRPFQVPQTVQPLINEVAVGNVIPLEAGWNDISFTIPAEHLQGPTARVTLHFSRSDLPIDVLPGITDIGQTGVKFRKSLTVKSGGPGIGDLAWMTVDGVEASNHRNGVNVTVLDPLTEEVEEVRGFDTTANEFERDKLHQFMADIPQGKIVLVALKGAATTYLNLDTVQALKSMGAATGPTDHAVSYALIGVKGAAEGTALEKESKTESVDLHLLPDDRALSSAVEWVRWQQ